MVWCLIKLYHIDRSHVDYLKTNCLKALDILKVVGHTDWGADQKTLLCLYRALVRSKLDYGCIVYGAASNNILKKLDPFHHQRLRIALGAFRTSHVTSLHAKAQEMSLKNRRKKLSMNYVLKLKTCAENPAYSCVFEPPNSKLFEKSRCCHTGTRAKIDGTVNPGSHRNHQTSPAPTSAF